MFNSENVFINITSKKGVTWTKVIAGNRDVDFVSVAPFEVKDEKIISDENVNVITYDFPCKMLKNFILPLWDVIFCHWQAAF